MRLVSYFFSVQIHIKDRCQFKKTKITLKNLINCFIIVTWSSKTKIWFGFSIEKNGCKNIVWAPDSLNFFLNCVIYKNVKDLNPPPSSNELGGGGRNNSKLWVYILYHWSWYSLLQSSKTNKHIQFFWPFWQSTNGKNFVETLKIFLVLPIWDFSQFQGNDTLKL